MSTVIVDDRIEQESVCYTTTSSHSIHSTPPMAWSDSGCRISDRLPRGRMQAIEGEFPDQTVEGVSRRYTLRERKSGPTRCGC